MAYVNQEKKAKIAAALKLVVPQGWKYSLAVRHHSTIVCTITAAPFDLIRAMSGSEYFNPETATEARVNTHYVRREFADECVADVFEKIVAALDTDNHDNSDIQSDYFDVGHYVDLRVGAWNRPFSVVAPKVAAKAA